MSAGRERAGGHGVAMSARLRRWLGRLHFSGALWYRLHLFAARRLPDWAKTILMVGFVGLFFVALGGVRRAIAANLDPVLGPTRFGWLSRWRRALLTLWNHAWCMTETYEGLAGAAGERTVTTEGRRHWDRLVADDGGFLLATAHVGHWEVGSHLVVPRSGRRIHVVRAEEVDPAAQRFLADLLAPKAAERYRVHFTRAEDPSLGARLLGALRRGDVVALQSDRPRGGARAAAVEMFGRAAEFPVGPAALARAAEVPILPVFVFRTGRRRSHIRFCEPVEVARQGDRRAALRAALQRLADEVERAVAERPHQWFCLQRVWTPASQPER